MVTPSENERCMHQHAVTEGMKFPCSLHVLWGVIFMMDTLDAVEYLKRFFAPSFLPIRTKPSPSARILALLLIPRDQWNMK